MTKKIIFTESDFKTLINGWIVLKDDTEIILQDIWYFVMEELIKNAKNR